MIKYPLTAPVVLMPGKWYRLGVADDTGTVEEISAWAPDAVQVDAPVTATYVIASDVETRWPWA